VLYTDGVTEAMNEAGEQFGLARLCSEVEAAGPAHVEEVRDRVLGAVGRWASTHADDMTVLVLRYGG